MLLSPLLPWSSSWCRWQILVPFGSLLVSSDPSKYLPRSVKAVVWLVVPEHSCWLQSPDVFICLCFPLSRLFSNTHSIRAWGRQGNVLGLPQTSIFQQKGWDLLMPDSPVGCRGEFAHPMSPVQYLKLSTKTLSLITVTNGSWVAGGCFRNDRAQYLYSQGPQRVLVMRGWVCPGLQLAMCCSHPCWCIPWALGVLPFLKEAMREG